MILDPMIQWETPTTVIFARRVAAIQSDRQIYLDDKGAARSLLLYEERIDLGLESWLLRISTKKGSKFLHVEAILVGAEAGA